MIFSRLHAVGFALASILAMTPAHQADADEIVFRDKSGRVITREELKNFTGKVNWQIVGEGSVPGLAKQLHEAGRSAGQRGDYKVAQENFEKAAKLAPGWPYPKYDAAFTWLLQKDAARAYQLYREVDAMAPRGFFTVKTAVHVLGREREGKYPQGTYLKFLSLEWTDSAGERKRIAQELAKQLPQASLSWYRLAKLEDDPAKKLAMIEKGLAGDGDVGTLGSLKLDKAIVLANTGRDKEAIAILGPLALDPTSPPDVEAFSRMLLAQVIGQRP